MLQDDPSVFRPRDVHAAVVRHVSLPCRIGHADLEGVLRGSELEIQLVVYKPDLGACGIGKDHAA